MNELINNPVFQSALLPLGAALVSSLLLRQLGWVWTGLGFAIAYAASVYFTVGFQFTPLTSTRKIFILAGMAVMLGLLLDADKLSRRTVPWLLTVLAIAAVSWVTWPAAKRLDGTAFWIMFIASSGYGAWIVTSFESLRQQPLPATTAAVMLGTGTGICALLGTSALLGQLGGTIGSAAGAYVLLLLFSDRLALGSCFTLPAAVLAALIGIAAVVYANLAWYILTPLAIIPVAARLPVKAQWPKLANIIVLSVYSAIFAMAAIIIAWKMAPTADGALF